MEFKKLFQIPNSRKFHLIEAHKNWQILRFLSDSTILIWSTKSKQIFFQFIKGKLIVKTLRSNLNFMTSQSNMISKTQTWSFNMLSKTRRTSKWLFNTSSKILTKN